ncbi:Predicted transcriptional regulator [Modicisalibacter ilicicola DSM 19980]|uniref:Predicted transcriptional regulator n=1 Tax=Modicisalibacter ilicicola DSM 19980 TaxID=1121942 RepID=A0A1M4YXQ9_9GAMM|nr:MarR family transcriptional regulator [Halomonas ilicicola]SHF10530.1 Predicted transcriptional regulator [Halomonas ilicicola DSM 19980]
MKTMKIGIMNRDEFRRRTIAIAKGDYRPAADEPKVWFDSVESMSQMLSTRNLELLRIIGEHKPQSLGELSSITGRKKESLSRTIKKMSEYGLVSIKEGPRHSKIPELVAEGFEVRLM